MMPNNGYLYSFSSTVVWPADKATLVLLAIVHALQVLMSK